MWRVSPWSGKQVDLLQWALGSCIAYGNSLRMLLYWYRLAEGYIDFTIKLEKKIKKSMIIRAET
jgi:hypothetical protein